MERVLQGSLYKKETLLLTLPSLKWEIRSAFFKQPAEVVLSSEILWKGTTQLTFTGEKGISRARCKALVMSFQVIFKKLLGHPF